MAICALGYLGIQSDKLADWSDFATRLLGMQQVDLASTSLAFRMDDRKQRLVVSNEPGDTLAFMGWEVEVFEQASQLREVGAGIQVERFNIKTRSLAGAATS